jgi:osmotically-inducible protein OsmY
MSEPETVKQARAAIERLAGISHGRCRFDLSLRDGALHVGGEVEKPTDKRRVLHAVRQVPGIGRCTDELRVSASQPRGDGQIRDALAQALIDDTAMRSCNIRVHNKGQVEDWLVVEERADCWLIVRVEAGVIRLEGQVFSLSHKRLAEALAWWQPGVRDVINELEVFPPEEDNDDEITDALLQVLEKDPLVRADRIRVTTRNGVVTLEGYLPQQEEKDMAEADAWLLPGVEAVVNRIELRR